MSFYRVHVQLDRGKGRIIPTGSITRLAWLRPEDQQRIVDFGAVSAVAPPPLHILPGWKARSKKLGAHGIIDAVQFLEADNVLLQKILGNRKEATIEKWKTELEQQLIAKPRKG